jgi:putative DNA primase/helicase
MTATTVAPESVEAILAAAGINTLRADSSAGDQEVALRALGGRAASLDAIRAALLRERAIQALKTGGLESPARLVDSAIGAARQDGGVAGAGSPVLFAAIEPWPSIVIGADLLNEIECVVRRYVVLPAEAAVVVALWVLHTHAIEAAQITPRLAIVSPTKRCGKSTMLKLLGALVRRPLAAANLTAAGLFRGIEAYEPTLLVDEADTFLEGREDLRGVLNAGHDRQSAMVLRCTGEDFEPHFFRVFAAVAIAAIGRLPDTLMDRSIVVEMRRKTGAETVDRFRRAEREGLMNIPRRCARWTTDNMAVLRTARPTIPDVDDRAADNWESLLAIADAAGADWPERARAAALRLSGMRAEADDGEDLAVQLLADVRAVFAERSEERLTSKAITAALSALEGRPWAEICRGRPITDRLVARLLGRFRVKPKSIRIGDATPKGYLRDDLADVFARYLAVPAATSATSSKSLVNASNAPPPRALDVADAETEETPWDYADVADVALDGDEAAS